MVEANVKIIGELKLFIDYVTTDEEIRKSFTIRDTDFIRDRKLSLARIAQMIINLPKRSLSIEVREFFENLVGGGKECTKGAFSLQRGKLRPEFFFIWNQVLVAAFYHYYGDQVKRWRGFRVFATDGSTMYLPDRDEIVKHFGKHSNQYSQVPLSRVIQVEDVLNKITVYGNIYSIATSEQEVVNRLADHYAEDSLLLLDRGFSNYVLMWLLLNQERERNFVIRCKTGGSQYAASFLKSKKRSKIITIYPHSNAISMLKKLGYIITLQTGIKVRLVKVTLTTGETEVLMTNLYDKKIYSNEDLKYLYGLRWSIEGCYDRQKNQQQLEIFSGHRVITIYQDYYANVFTGNMQSIIEKQCTKYITSLSRKRKYRCKINRNISWSHLKHNIVRLFITERPIDILITLQKAFERYVEPERPGRTVPRRTKSRRLTGKYQTFTNYRRAI